MRTTVKTTVKIAIASAFTGLALTALAPATANADPVDTINLTDVADIDSLPVCVQEDCSDQVGQVGVWLDKDTGDWYLSRGEQGWLIIDNTVTDGRYLGPTTVGSDPTDEYAYDAGAYVGGWN